MEKSIAVDLSNRVLVLNERCTDLDAQLRNTQAELITVSGILRRTNDKLDRVLGFLEREFGPMSVASKSQSRPDLVAISYPPSSK